MDYSLPVRRRPWVFSRVFWSKFKSLLPIVGLAATLPILVAGVQVSQNLLSKATTPTPTPAPTKIISFENATTVLDPKYIALKQRVSNPYKSSIQITKTGLRINPIPDASYKFSVWSDNNGQVGNLLGEKIIKNTQPPGQDWVYAAFDNPITISDPYFFLGVERAYVYFTLILSIGNDGKDDTYISDGKFAIQKPSDLLYQVYGTVLNPPPTTPTAIPSPTSRPSPTPTPDPKLACTQTGGVWREFPDSCADTCPTGQPRVCLQVITDSCDCGPRSCWSGSSCIPNPTTPTAIPSPTSLPSPPPRTPNPPTPKPLPDLTVNQITKNRAKNWLVVNICNNGPVAIPETFDTRLTQPKQTGEWSFSSQGFTANFCTDISLDCQGMGEVCSWPTMTALTDSTNQVIEANETNNQLTVTLNPNTAPVITTKRLPLGRLGVAYKATLVGTDADPDQILTLTTSNLPPGITQKPCSTLTSNQKGSQIRCDLSGKPQKTGTWRVNVLLQDNQGGTTTKTLPLTITKKYWLF